MSQYALSQERYLSSSECVELRGISGIAAATRAAALDDPAEKEMVLFIQALSLRGGVSKIATHLLGLFPERIGTQTMHRLGPVKEYTPEQALKIEGELYPGDPRHNPICKAAARDMWGEEPTSRDLVPAPASEILDECKERAQSDLADLLLDYCINPSAKCVAPYFKDLMGALVKVKERHAEKAQKEFVSTEISKLVFKTLKAGLDICKPVGVTGESQIGKTTAAQAFVEMNLGRARFVSLSGVTNKSSAFRSIARCLGIPHGQGRTCGDLQARIEEFLQKSKIMLVIDEGHYLFAQGVRVTTRPELIDWVNTALYNHHVPFALITTPQFFTCLNRAEKQVGWNSDQFKGRMRRWVELPKVASRSDLKAVASKLFAGAKDEHACIDYAVGYALTSKRYFPALVHAFEEAKLLSGERITFEALETAVAEYCAPSDVIKSGVAEPAKRGRSGAFNGPLTDPPIREIQPKKEPRFSIDREVSPMVPG